MQESLREEIRCLNSNGRSRRLEEDAGELESRYFLFE